MLENIEITRFLVSMGAIGTPLFQSRDRYANCFGLIVAFFDNGAVG
jgi:hypothetical protein